MKKQPEVIAQTRRNLLDAFWQLYQDKYLNEITVKNITDRAGYNRCTFYAYFRSVQDILEQMESELLIYIQDNVANILLPAILSGDMPNLAMLYTHTIGDYLRVLLRKNGDPNFTVKLKQALCDIYFKSLGLPQTDSRTEYLLDFTVSGILAVLIRWYAKSDVSEKEVFFFLRSLLTEGSISVIFSDQNRFKNHESFN